MALARSFSKPGPVTDLVASDFRLHVGNAGTRCHVDSLCGCCSDKQELSICWVYRNSSTTFDIGQFFVAEQGLFFFLEYGRCRTVARSLHEHKQ